MDDYNSTFGGFQENANPFGGIQTPAFTQDSPGPVEEVQTVTEETTEPSPSPEVREDANSTEESETTVKPKNKGGRPRRNRNGSSGRKTEDVSTEAVRRILDYREKLEIVDDETRKIAANLLNLKDPEDEVRFIVALMNNEKTGAARKTLKDLKDTVEMDDLTFGSVMGTKTHADRKALFELEEQIAPAKTEEVLDGGKFPSNDPMKEVIIIRKIQNESPDFGGVITSINELLS